MAQSKRPEQTDDEQGRYRAFVLRIWPNEGAGWRCSLESVATGDKRQFALPEQMLSHLYALFSAETDSPQ